MQLYTFLVYDAIVCIILCSLVRSGSMSASSSNPLRISHPKIDKLACQARGVDIFAKGEIPLCDATIYILILDAESTAPKYYNTKLEAFQDVFAIFLKFMFHNRAEHYSNHILLQSRTALFP